MASTKILGISTESEFKYLKREQTRKRNEFRLTELEVRTTCLGIVTRDPTFRFEIVFFIATPPLGRFNCAKYDIHEIRNELFLRDENVI